MTLENIDAYTKENLPVQLSDVLFYQVKDIYKDYFHVTDYR